MRIRTVYIIPNVLPYMRSNTHVRARRRRNNSSHFVTAIHLVGLRVCRHKFKVARRLKRRGRSRIPQTALKELILNAMTFCERNTVSLRKPEASNMEDKFTAEDVVLLFMIYMFYVVSAMLVWRFFRFQFKILVSKIEIDREQRLLKICLHWVSWCKWIVFSIFEFVLLYGEWIC